jgi:hypothetical protein
MCSTDKCDVCGTKFKSVKFDCKVVTAGCWGWLCLECFWIHGPRKLGTGLGQKYNFVNNSWKKVEG